MEIKHNVDFVCYVHEYIKQLFIKECHMDILVFRFLRLQIPHTLGDYEY